jgi:hypothetical protein
MEQAAGPHGLLSPGKKVRRIPLGALQEREFRLFFTGQMVPLLGDAVTPFALAWAVLTSPAARGTAGTGQQS